MTQRAMLPAAIQAFVDAQPTLPLDDADQASDSRPYPYSEYWRRAIAGMLLSGRVKPKNDGAPNMTDVNRIGKEFDRGIEGFRGEDNPDAKDDRDPLERRNPEAPSQQGHRGNGDEVNLEVRFPQENPADSLSRVDEALHEPRE